MTQASGHPEFRHRDTCPGARENTFRGRLGDLMIGCRACRAAVPLHHLEAPNPPAGTQPAPAASSPGRYVLSCARCDTKIRLHKPRPRVPLCDHCKTPRHRSRQETS